MSCVESPYLDVEASDVAILIDITDSNREIRSHRWQTGKIERLLDAVVHLARNGVVLVAQSPIDRETGSGAPVVVDKEGVLPETHANR